MLQGRRSGRTVSAIHGNFAIRRNGCWCLPMRARSGDDRRIHCVGLAVATVTAGGVMHSPAGTQSRSSSRSSSKVINNAAPPEFGSIVHRTDPLAAKPFTASIRSDNALSSLLIRCDNTRPRPGSVARELLGWPLAPLLPDPRGRRLPRRPSQARPGPTPTRAAPTRPPRWSGSSSHRTTCPKRRCGRRCSVERLTRYTAHTIVQPGQPRRALTKVRREGVAVANEEMSLGSVSVASPVLASIFGDLPPP